MKIHTHWTVRAVVLVSLFALLSVGVLGAPTVGEEMTTDAEGDVISLNHTSVVSLDGEFEVVIETENSAGTIVEFDPDEFAVNASSDDAIRVEDNRVEFLDANAANSTYTIDVDVEDGTDGAVGNITAWVNAEDRSDADDEQTSSFVLSEDDDEETGAVTVLDHPMTVETGDEFNVTVETENSAGTIVEFDADAFAVDLSSDDAVQINDNQVKFLDPNADDSTYTITAAVDGVSDDAVGTITAWVNAEDRNDADDEATSEFDIIGDDETVESVDLSLAESEIAAGTTTSLTATATLANGTTQDVTREANLSVANESVATVTDDGIVTGDDVGMTQLTAVLENTTGTANLTVTEPEFDSLSVSLESETVAAGTDTSVEVIATLTDGTTEDVTANSTFASNDPDVATVADDGTVSSTNQGTTVITATFQDATATAELTVSEPAVTEFSAALEAESLTPATETSVVVDATLSDGTTEDVTTDAELSIANESVATVANDGTVSGENLGETTLTADHEGETAEVGVTVTAVESPDVTTLTVEEGLTNDTATVTGEIDSGDVDIEAVQLGLSAEFTSFTETTNQTGVSDGGTFTETVSTDNLVGDGRYAAYATVSDVEGNEIEVENDSVEVDTTPPEVQPRVSNLSGDPATLDLQSDEEFNVTDIEITAENDTGVAEERSVTTPPGFQSGFSGIEFDGTPIGEADTTFSIQITAKDEAGNEITDTITSTVTGYEIEEDGTATVDPNSVDAAFELNTTVTDNETATAAVGQSISPPADTSTDPDQVTGEFIDVTDIGVDESDLDGATVRIPLDTLDADTRDAVEDDSLELFRSEDGDENFSSATVTDVEVKTINGTEFVVGEVPGFSVFAVGVTDTTPPEVTSQDIDPGTEPEPDQSLTATFEYSDDVSDIDVSATDISVSDFSGPTNQISRQITDSTATVTVETLEADETFELELTVSDTAGNQRNVTETISVQDIDTGDDNDGNGGGGAPAPPAPPEPPTIEPDDDEEPEPGDDQESDDEDDIGPVDDESEDETDDDGTAVDDDDSEEVNVPGFGFLLTLVALVGAALLAVYRND